MLEETPMNQVISGKTYNTYTNKKYNLPNKPVLVDVVAALPLVHHLLARADPLGATVDAPLLAAEQAALLAPPLLARTQGPVLVVEQGAAAAALLLLGCRRCCCCGGVVVVAVDNQVGVRR